MPRNFLGCLASLQAVSSRSVILSEHPGLQGNRDKRRELEKGGENNREEADRHLEKSFRAYLFLQGRDRKGRERGES